MHNFLKKVIVTSMHRELLYELERPLTISELVSALLCMRNNESLGPDGFTVEFYKAFSTKFIPIWHSVYLRSLANGSLPLTLRQASISVLLKKNKDPALCTSYRPLSLMNEDTKILLKALARWLEKDYFTRTLWHFKIFFYNIQTLLDIIYSNEDAAIPEVVISIDAEKAFVVCSGVICP